MSHSLFGKGIMKRETGKMSYEQMKKSQLVEICRERQLNAEEQTKARLVDLLYSKDQKRNDGPGSQGTSSPLAESPACRRNRRSLKCVLWVKHRGGIQVQSP